MLHPRKELSDYYIYLRVSAECFLCIISCNPWDNLMDRCDFYDPILETGKPKLQGMKSVPAGDMSSNLAWSDSTTYLFSPRVLKPWVFPMWFCFHPNHLASASLGFSVLWCHTVSSGRERCPYPCLSLHPANMPGKWWQPHKWFLHLNLKWMHDAYGLRVERSFKAKDLISPTVWVTASSLKWSIFRRVS